MKTSNVTEIQHYNYPIIITKIITSYLPRARAVLGNIGQTAIVAVRTKCSETHTKITNIPQNGSNKLHVG